MLYSPWLVIISLLAFSYLKKSRAAFIAAFAYFLNCAFLWFFLDILDGYTLYSICAAISYACLRFIKDDLFPAIALSMYAYVNLMSAADYLLYSFHLQNDTIFYQYYFYIYAIVDFGIIALCAAGNDNDGGDFIKNNRYYNSGLEYLPCTAIHIQKLQKGNQWKH